MVAKLKFELQRFCRARFSQLKGGTQGLLLRFPDQRFELAPVQLAIRPSEVVRCLEIDVADLARIIEQQDPVTGVGAHELEFDEFQRDGPVPFADMAEVRKANTEQRAEHDQCDPAGGYWRGREEQGNYNCGLEDRSQTRSDTTQKRRQDDGRVEKQ